MRRHEKEGILRHELQAQINAEYRKGQIIRQPPNAKYPGTDERGVPIIWHVSDRFDAIARISYAIRYGRIIGGQRLIDDKEFARRQLVAIRTMEKPRLP